MTAPKKPPTAAPVVNTPRGYQETLQSPTKNVGTVTSGYGPRVAPKAGASKYHKGVDIGAPAGTPVYASASGIVVFSGTQSGYGNHIEIRHDNNTVTSYSHLSSRLVKVGATVAQGEIIGKVGETGTATAPHLHYEIRENGVRIDPAKAGSVTVDSNNRSQAASKAADAEKVRKPQYSDDYVDKLAELEYNPDEIVNRLISGDHFKDNPANDFHNLTYHWRFFVTSDTEVLTEDATVPDATIATFYEELAKYQQIVIAETGVTGFNIDSVNLEATVGTDFQTGSTSFTKIEMKITEPNGAIFLDALRNSALKLGVQNYQKTFFYLELTFKGYDEDGSINLQPFADMPNGGRWLWTVVISDIQVNMSAGGGTYTLTMLPLADSLSAGRYNVIPTTVTVSGTTVGDYMKTLCDELNTHYTTVMSDANIITYDYKFHNVRDVMTADEVAKMSITPSEPEVNEERTLAFEKDGKSAIIAKGHLITDALDNMMMSCERAQKLALDVVGDTIDINKASKKGHRQSILWRMEPEIHFTGYDPVYNDYCKKITLHIYGFRNHAAVLNSPEEKSSADVQKAIIADMAYRNFLPKKYEYIFTGKNSEVLEMDLTFNTKWAAIIPRLASANIDQVEVQAKALPEDTKNKQNIGLERNPDKPKTPSDIAATGQSATTDYVRATELREAKEREKAEKVPLGQWTEEDEKELKKLQQDFINASQVASSARKDVQAVRAKLRSEQPYLSPSKKYERDYGEDLTNQSDDYETLARKAFPVTVQSFDVDTANGSTGQWHSGQAVYGALLNQVYGPLATQFFQIEITVRGDPYWIGAGSFEQLITRKSDVFSGAQPNFSEGCNAFLFKMGYPLGQTDDGELILNVNETVTGVYQVNHISHRFDDGKFTQAIKGYRLPLLNVYQSLYKKINPDQFEVNEDK